MASLFKRKKQYWVSFYLDGKQVRKSLQTNNLKLARAKVKKIEYELATGELHVASKLHLPEILESFCRHLKAKRTFKSCKNDISRLRVFFGPVCAPLIPGKPNGWKRPPADKYAGKHVKVKLLEDVTPQVINRFLSARIEKEGWSAKTANLMRQTLHKLFNYAIKHHGFISKDRRFPNPAAGVDRQIESAPHIRFLTLEQIDEQLEVLAGHPLIHEMVATYIYAGLRREELLWLTHQDVDLQNRLIRVQAKNIDGEYWQPKTKRNRVVPISDALFKILSNYKSSQDSTWFFPSPTGKRWDTDNFSQDLRKINKANSLEWSCLDFRHTFGSHLAQKGVSLYKISSLMGNSPEIARKHYAALMPSEMQEEVEFVTATNNSKDNPDSDPTAAILQQLLAKINRLERQNDLREHPHLRVAR